MCRVNKGDFSTPLTGLIGKKKKKECAECWDQRGKTKTQTQLTEPACPEQKVKAVSKHQN